MNLRLLKKAFIKTLPIMAGYLVLGMGFGILLKVNGYGLLWALAMSIFIYAGSMQFVGISLISGAVSPVSAAMTTLMVNARHIFYGISMINRYKGAGLKKIYLMTALTDETYSLVCHDDGKEENVHLYYFLISLLDQFYWVLGSAAGSLLGAVIPFDTTGIDFSMTALFVTVFVDQWLTADKHSPALIGLGVSALCLLIFGSDSFLLPSMAGILILLSFMRKKIEGGGKDE